MKDNLDLQNKKSSAANAENVMSSTSGISITPPPYNLPTVQRKNNTSSMKSEMAEEGEVVTSLKKEKVFAPPIGGDPPVQRLENNTGMPDGLKSGIESLSGIGMDDVSVNYNSNKPAQLQAHAYAQGSNIEIGPGQEQHLPHEAWHVVQQKQGRVSPSTTMGKTYINDDSSLEREADVMGEKALNLSSQSTKSSNLTIQSKSKTIQRTETEDIAWANSANTKIESIQDTVALARTRLGSEGIAAIAHIRAAQIAYNAFDTLYENAVTQFTAGVAAAQKKEKALRDAVKFVATLALGAQFPLLGAMNTAMSTSLDYVKHAATLGSALQPSGPAAPVHSPAMAARQEDRVDWSNLLSTALTAFNNNLISNSNLTTIQNNCIQTIRLLGNVRAGTYEGTNPQNSELGLKASSLAANSVLVVSQISTIGNGEISGPASTLSSGIISELSGLTNRSLQQDIGIRWIASLNNNERDEIDTADDYLEEIGLIGANGRLGHGVGSYTSDIDERILLGRARAENTAMRMVGKTVDWLGGYTLGNPRQAEPQPTGRFNFRPEQCLDIPPQPIWGRIRNSYNVEFNASGTTENVTTEGGGYVKVLSYEIRHMDSSDVEWSGAGEILRGINNEVRFNVEGVGQTGGGARAAGPVMHATP